MPDSIHYLSCSRCGTPVSTGFVPLPTDTPDQGLIVRAWIACPECIEAQAKPAIDPPPPEPTDIGPDIPGGDVRL